MDNTEDEAEEIRGVVDRLGDELIVLDRLKQNVAAAALQHVLDLLGDERGKLGSDDPAKRKICRSD